MRNRMPAFVLIVLLVASQAASTDAAMKVLVDATRDGGVWWAGAGGDFRPEKWHQGKELADYLRALGHEVTELPQSQTLKITPELLAGYDLVIRPNGAYYTDAELAAYERYVHGGGRLFLLEDHGGLDPLGMAFGVEFAGSTLGDDRVGSLVAHPMTVCAKNGIDYGTGSGIIHYPESATIIGRLSGDGAFLDLNDNKQRDLNEPVDVPLIGTMTHGAGCVVFSGDTNMWESVPQPLVKNTLHWLATNCGRSGCLRDGRSACLSDSRFRVSAKWTTAESTGDAQVMCFDDERAETADSAFFWFFSPANFELGVKVLDACNPFERRWVFVSGMTNQAFDVTVEDTVTGATWKHSNALGTFPLTRGDTDAFRCETGSAGTTSGSKRVP